MSDRKIIDYVTVMCKVPTESNRTLIRKLINDGWQPHGGVACDGVHLYQAMVKYEEPKKKITRKYVPVKFGGTHAENF